MCECAPRAHSIMWRGTPLAVRHTKGVSRARSCHRRAPNGKPYKVQYWIGNRSPCRSPLCGALTPLASLRLALHEPFRLTQYGVRPAKEQRHHARGRPGRERCPPHLLDLAVLHRRDQLRERPVDCRDQPAHVRGVDSAAEHLSAQGRTPDSLKAEGAEERWEGWRRGGRDRPSEGELPSGRA